MSVALSGKTLADSWLGAGERFSVNELPSEDQESIYLNTKQAIKDIKKINDPHAVQTIFFEFISNLALPQTDVIKQESLANLLIGSLAETSNQDGKAKFIFKKLVTTLQSKSGLSCLDQNTSNQLNQVNRILNKKQPFLPEEIVDLIGIYAKRAAHEELPPELQALFKKVKAKVENFNSKPRFYTSRKLVQTVKSRSYFDLFQIHTFFEKEKELLEQHKKEVKHFLLLCNLSKNLKFNKKPPINLYEKEISLARQLYNFFRGKNLEKEQRLFFKITSYLPPVKNLTINLNDIKNLKISNHNLSKFFPSLKRAHIIYSSMDNCRLLENLKFLKTLSFEGGAIDGAFLASLPSSLAKLSFENCKTFGDKDLEHLKVSNSIQSLSLEQSKISNFALPLIREKFPYLKTLNLSCCNVGSFKRSTLAYLPKFLCRLFLKNCKNVCNRDLKKFPILKNLQLLSLKKSCISNPGLLELEAKFPNLKQLDLSFCDVGGGEAGTFSKLPKSLYRLSLGNCTKFNDEDLKNFPVLPNLQELALKKSQISTSAISEIGIKFPQLKILNLSGCNIEGYDQKSFSGLPLSLCKLSLKNCGNFDDKSLQKLPGLSLQELSLRKTAVSNLNVSELAAKFPYLRELDLSSTHASDATLKDIKNLKSLRILHLDDTFITTTGLKDLKFHPSLEELHLSKRFNALDVQSLLPECRLVFT